jgi:hypothetical protein
MAKAKKVTTNATLAQLTGPKMAPLTGQRIKEVRLMTPTEMAHEGWTADRIDMAPVVIVTENGTRIYPARDPEGNGPGCLFGVLPNGTDIRVPPEE